MEIKNKIFTAVVTVILTTAASTVVVNTINDSRSLVVIQLNHIEQRLNKMDSYNLEDREHISKLHERLASIRSDLRSLDHNMKYSKLELNETNEEFKERLIAIDRQISELKRKARIY